MTGVVASFGASIVVKATVTLALTLLTLRLARHSSASVRHLVLAAGFGMLAVLPFAEVIAPPVRVEVAPVPIVLEDYLTESFVLDRGIPANDSSLESTAAATPDRWRLNLTPIELVAIAWVGGFVLFAVPVLIGLIQVRRLRRTGLPWRAGQRLVDSLTDEAGLPRRVDVLLHESVAAPATGGLRRHVILFPRDAGTWSDEDIVRAAVHEVEHVRRADSVVNGVTRVICAAYWFHPLVWIAWRRLALQAERACDDAVLRGAEATVYADQLVTLAGRLSTNTHHPLLAMANRSDLVQRVDAVLDPRQARGHVGLTVAISIGIAACAVILAISPLQAVRASSSAATGVQDRAARPAPQFEVATIRINRSGERRAIHNVVPATGQVTITNVTVRDLIQEAYGVRLLSQLVNLPDWTSTMRVDVVAKAASPAPVAALQRMLQPLLAEYFELAVHNETRDMDVFAMVVANPGRIGPELRRSESACDDVVGTAGGFARAPEGAPNQKGTCGILPGGAGRIVARGLDMPGLAAFIGTSPGRMVIDRTGLSGRFDVDLTYTPSAFAAAALAQRPGAVPPPGVDPSGPPLVTALQEQLGLRLEPVRAPVEVLVIDRVEPMVADPPKPAAQAAPFRQPAFDVASIRKNAEGGVSPRIESPRGRFQATNVPLQSLIRWAYATPEPQIVGGADWIRSERFDIAGTASPDGWSTDRVRLMVRALLAERFGLVAHTETRDVAIYTLMMVKPGAFGANLRSATFNCTPGGPSRMTDGKVQCGLLISGNASGASLRGGGMAMADFVRTLTEYAGRPVVDGTGLAERYDFELQFTADRSAVPGAPAPGGLTTNVDGDIPPLPTALREQLGLRLEAGRGPVELLVIDRVTPPTAN